MGFRLTVFQCAALKKKAGLKEVENGDRLEGFKFYPGWSENKALKEGYKNKSRKHSRKPKTGRRQTGGNNF